MPGPHSMATANGTARGHRPGRHALAVAVALAMTAAACGGGGASPTTTTSPSAGDTTTTVTSPEPAVTVIATTTILGDVLKAIVGDRGTVEVVMPIGADPHDFTASSRQVAAMQDADLVIANGLDLEEGLIDVLRAVEEAGTPVVWIAEELDPLPYYTDDHGHDHDDDHGHDHDDDHGHDHDNDDDHHDDDHVDNGHDDHDHGEFDPHVWMDPIRMATAAMLIADALSDIAPDVDWATPAQAYADALTLLDEEIAALVSTLPEDRRLLVTNHHSLGYFAARYGFTVVGTVIPGGTTLGAPSSAELSALVDLIEDLHISAIFGENIDSVALVTALAAEVDHPVAVVVLTTDSLGQPGTDEETLIGLLRANARLIVEALEG
jgi:zinc/manganese transport system substrate-binding protein